MANGLSNLIGVVIFAVIGIILDVAVLMPIMDGLMYTTDATSGESVLAVDDTTAVILEIVPLFVALAILLAVAGSMLSYYKKN